MSTTTTRPAHPARFRQAEARGRRIGRPLLIAGGIDGEIDEALMARIGDALLERDELGARLAEAMRLPPGDPDRVSHAQLAAALAAPRPEAGLPPALAALLEEAWRVPDWVDWERVERGAAAYRFLGRSAHDVLLQLSLIGGYRFGGPADLLVLTGGLGGANTLRRLAETQTWTLAVSQPGALRPGAEGWRLTVHVRAMHALINARFERRWDQDRFGLPINQADQAGTLGLFDATVIIGCRALGVPLSRQQRDDLMHLWRYLGWLLGVDTAFLTDDERERTRINYHILVAAGAQTQAGRDLARASVDAQTERSFGHAGPTLERLHQRYARARVLSMLTAFVGVRGMRDLGLPARVPWAFALAFVGNTARYRLLGALPGGRRRLEERGARVQQELLASTLRGSPARVGALPDAH
jgi:hypothetical protein